MRKIIYNFQRIVLWYAGFRGAMATALALSAVQTFSVGRFGELFLILTLLTAGLNVFKNISYRTNRYTYKVFSWNH